MKKNAIVIAGILFAGAAASQAQDRDTSREYTPDVSVSRSTELVDRDVRGELIPPSDPTLTGQYDPATGGFEGSEFGTASSQDTSNLRLSVQDYHADSSIRGGSNEARGWARQHLEREPSGQAMNQSFQADSSIRGGWRMERKGDFEPSSGIRGDRYKADSSVRGGSNEARFPHRARQFGDDHLSQGSSYSDRGDITVADPNWNPSDDLLVDDTMSHEQRGFSQFNNDASLDGASRSQSGTISSTSPLDDMDADVTIDDSGVGAAATSEIGSSSSSSEVEQDLNSSSNLESNIAGEYELDTNRDADQPAPGEYPVRSSDLDSSELESERFESSPESKLTDNSELSHQSISRESDSSGAAASSETGASSSSLTPQYSESSAPADLDEPGRTGYDLFRNNRAQGVGSAATGEFGSSASSNYDLAERVKATLTRESTGTHGMMPHDVARNVQVTSEGGGTVVLKGTVSSEKYKEMIGIRAREIRGVNRVDNQITVTPEADSSLRDISIGRDLEDVTDQLQDIDRVQD